MITSFIMRKDHPDPRQDMVRQHVTVAASLQKITSFKRMPAEALPSIVPQPLLRYRQNQNYVRQLTSTRIA
jgi:hypothetical protein